MGKIYIKQVKSSENGCLDGDTRATFIVNKKTLNAFKKVSYWERMQLRDAICQAMELFIREKLESNLNEIIEEDGKSKED